MNRSDHAHRTGNATLQTPSSVASWLRERRAASQLRCESIPLVDLSAWEMIDGKLVHQTRGFFSIVGVRANSCGPLNGAVQQPLIWQPEIGILGFLSRTIQGKSQLLIQAKAEPGNVGDVQIAPTTQATESNYRRLHGGLPTQYLHHFTRPLQGQSVVSDSLQSEQGTRFLGKYNRNVVVHVDGDGPEPVSDFWTWVDVRDLLPHLHQDFVVNTDARSVLTCCDWWWLSPSGEPFGRWPEKSAFAQSLWQSFHAGPDSAEHDYEAILSQLTRFRAVQSKKLCVIPLDEVDGWRIDDSRIVDASESTFQVCGNRVCAASREVTHWDQPLVHSFDEGKMLLLCQRRRGVMHFLLQMSPEIGFRESAQFGPTLQCGEGEQPHAGSLKDIAILAESDSMTEEHVSCKQSDEGGRFFRSVASYCIRELNPNEFVPEEGSTCWVTLAQLFRLLKVQGLVNNELRSAVSLLLPYL